MGGPQNPLVALVFPNMSERGSRIIHDVRDPKFGYEAAEMATFTERPTF